MRRLNLNVFFVACFSILTVMSGLPVALSNIASLIDIRALMAQPDNQDITSSSQHNVTSRIHDIALSWDSSSWMVQRSIARHLAYHGLWEESLFYYQATNRQHTTPITLLEEAKVLRALARSVEALTLYEQSGYVEALWTQKSPDPGLLPNPHYTDIARLYVEAAREHYFLGDWDKTIEVAPQALKWSSDSKVLSEAATVLASAYEAQGNHEASLTWLWQSVSAQPGPIDDPRYDQLCQLVLHKLVSERAITSLPNHDLLYVLRCQQWLGEHDSVIKEGEARLRQSQISSEASEDLRLIECLVAESMNSLPDKPAASPTPVEDMVDCALPFPGNQFVEWDGLERTMPTYQVGKMLDEERFLIAVVVNKIDLDLGLPVATHFYWAATETDRAATVTYTRTINLAPNAGFEYERLLGSAMENTLPIGYPRDIYYALPETRALSSIDISGEPETILSLHNRTIMSFNNPPDSSGLTSHHFAVSPGDIYIQGAQIYVDQADLRLGHTWVTEPSREVYNFVKLAKGSFDWQYVAGLVETPLDAHKGAIWLLNYRSQGQAAFDQLIFLKVPVNLGKE